LLAPSWLAKVNLDHLQIVGGAAKSYADCLLHAVKAVLRGVLGSVAGVVIAAKIVVGIAGTAAVNAMICAKRWTRLPKMRRFKTK
jgi:hypothetical protein